MSAFELISEIEKLPVSEQMLVIERAMHSIRIAELQTRMRQAAALLYNDYTNDSELTAFTALDAEDFMNQSEIWLVDLEPVRGAEIKKTRPCLIVSADSIGKLPLKVVVPLTDWKEGYDIADWMVKLLPSTSNNLLKESGVDCFQIRSLSQDRFIKRIESVSSTDFNLVKIALAKVLSLF